MPILPHEVGVRMCLQVLVFLRLGQVVGHRQTVQCDGINLGKHLLPPAWQKLRLFCNYKGLSE